MRGERFFSCFIIFQHFVKKESDRAVNGDIRPYRLLKSAGIIGREVTEVPARWFDCFSRGRRFDWRRYFIMEDIDKRFICRAVFF